MSKGIFIPDITVEMFRTASLEGIETLLTEGCFEDIEIVRCKDCKYSSSDGGAMVYCDIAHIPINDNDFCSYGERREE